MLILSLLLWFAVVFCLGCFVEWLWRNATGQVISKLVWIPGVVVHELSHTAACLATGAKVNEVVIFEESGGHVTHEKSKIPVLGQLLISFAPLAGNLFVIRICWELLSVQDPASPFHVALPMSPQAFVYVFRGICNFAKEAFVLLGNVAYHDWKSYPLLYVAISCAMTMSPSKADVKNALGGLGLAFGILILLERLPHTRGLVRWIAAASGPIVRFGAVSMWVCVMIACVSGLLVGIVRRLRSS